MCHEYCSFDFFKIKIHFLKTTDMKRDGKSDLPWGYKKLLILGKIEYPHHKDIGSHYFGLFNKQVSLFMK